MSSRDLIQNKNLNLVWASLLVEEFRRCGAGPFVLCPGSRVAPLALAVGLHGNVEEQLHFDERGAAFYALGYGKATGRPAVLCCTSGSACANFYPAIIEARMDRVPLIILTTDRPFEYYQTGFNQTFDQTRLFGHQPLFQVDIPSPTLDVEPEALLSLVDQAFYRSIGPEKGPVHLNLHFREPLDPREDGRDYEPYLKDISKWRRGTEPYSKYQPSVRMPVSLESFIGAFKGKRRPCIVLGPSLNEESSAAAMELARALRWPLLPDVRSSLRYCDEEGVVPHFDLSLVEEVESPDAILHLGGVPTSKRFLQWMKKLRPDPYFQVLNAPDRADPHHRVTHRLQAHEGTFCRDLLKAADLLGGSELWDIWQKRSERVSRVLSEIYAESSLNEWTAARVFSEGLKMCPQAFVASSMPIRLMEMFGSHDCVGVHLEANRGLSGIDGIVATACGMARGHGKPLCLLLGDLSLLHDLNSLAMLRDHSQPVFIMVLNNQGGGIFNFLPIAQYEGLKEKYFRTPHQWQFSSAAQLFDLDYEKVESLDSLSKCWEKALEGGKSVIVEVSCCGKESFKAIRHIQERIREASPTTVYS